MTEPSPHRGTALAAFLAQALEEFEGTTAAGLHPIEVCIALGAVAGARMAVEGLGADQVELLLVSMIAGARETLGAARDG